MICEKLDNFNFNNIIINDPIKNSVIQYNYFYKLSYSNDIIALNSIFILFELSNIIIDNDKVTFIKNETNNNVFNKLIEIEEYLLSLINEYRSKLSKFKELYDNKTFKFSQSDDIDKFNNYNFLNTFVEKNNTKKFVLKISGIWESKDNIGLTFKILIIDKYITCIG